MIPLTAAAVSRSFAAWVEVAKDGNWNGSETVNKAGVRTGGSKSRNDEAARVLGEQVSRWYSLLVLSQQPETYATALTILRNWRATRRAIRAFWPQLVTLGFEFAAAGGLGWAVETGNQTAWITAVLGSLGGSGVSLAGVTALLKRAATDLTAHLRAEVLEEAIAVGVTCVPPKPSSVRSDHRAARSAVVRAVRADG